MQSVTGGAACVVAGGAGLVATSSVDEALGTSSVNNASRFLGVLATIQYKLLEPSDPESTPHTVARRPDISGRGAPRPTFKGYIDSNAIHISYLYG